MLTCHAESAPSPFVLAECAAGHPVTMQAVSKTIRCRIQLTPFALTPDSMALEGHYDERHCLIHAFPAEATGLPPLTCLGWQAVPERMTIETLHTYPETGEGVRSRSVFTPRL